MLLRCLTVEGEDALCLLVAAAAVRGAGPQHGLLHDVLIHVLHQVLHVRA